VNPDTAAAVSSTSVLHADRVVMFTAGLTGNDHGHPGVAPGVRGTRERRYAVTLLTTVTKPPATADRCDRCGAQGKVRIVLAGGGDLVFCGHHARQYDSTIRSVATEVVLSEVTSES
jgi:hypothetical protein